MSAFVFDPRQKPRSVGYRRGAPDQLSDEWADWIRTPPPYSWPAIYPTSTPNEGVDTAAYTAAPSFVTNAVYGEGPHGYAYIPDGLTGTADASRVGLGTYSPVGGEARMGMTTAFCGNAATGLNTGWLYIMSGDTASNYWSRSIVFSNGSLSVRYRDNSGTEHTYTSSAGLVIPGQLHTLTTEVDFGDRWRVWLDGRLLHDAAVGAGSMSLSSGSLSLGGAASSTNNFFGWIYDLHIWTPFNATPPWPDFGRLAELRGRDPFGYLRPNARNLSIGVLSGISALTGTPSDEIALSDEPTYTDGKVLTDGFAIAEDFTTAWTEKPYGDGIAFSDALTSVEDTGDEFRALADGLAFGEDFTTVWSEPFFGDGFAISDAVGGGGGLTESVQDDFAIDDCFDIGMGELFDDEEILFSDSVVGVVDIAAFFGENTDGIAFTDEIPGTGNFLGYSVSATDTIAIADILFSETTAGSTEFTGTPTDGLAFSDAPAIGLFGAVETITDGFALNDTEAHTVGEVMIEFILFNDSVVGDRNIGTSPGSDGLSEEIVFTDAATYPLDFDVSDRRTALANLRNTTVEANRM